jgi:hypothetical protein
LISDRSKSLTFLNYKTFILYSYIPRGTTRVVYTCRDEEIAYEFEATLLGCDSLIGQISTLLADALKNLKNASGAGDPVGHAEDAVPLNVVARGYIAGEENDNDDSDYSSCSLSDDTDG